MSADWFDGYAAGDFLPGVPDAVRAEIDAAGETVAYCQGYTDGVDQAAAKLRNERWEGYFEAMADVAASERMGPCPIERVVRHRPLHGAGLRTRVRNSGPGGGRA